MNELDRCYEALRNNSWGHLSPGKRKRREAGEHERIRKLKAEGMKPTTEPICSNGRCGATVSGWGQRCGDCLR